MAVEKQVTSEKRDRLTAEILARYPPVQHLEELFGPEPEGGESAEVDAFLEARKTWQLPYARHENER